MSVRVLLVENPVAARPLMELLVGRAMQVAAVASLADARTHVAGGAPDVILLGLALPDSSGLDSLTVIREIVPETPVVLVAAADEEEEAADGLRIGAWAYVVKGAITSRGLVEALRSAIASQRVASALQRTKASHRCLVANASFGIFRVDPSGRFLDVNQAFVTLLGHTSADDVLALNVATDVYADAAQFHALVSDGPTADEVDVAWRKKDGTDLTVRLTGSAARDDKGAIDSIEVVVDDVTGRRQLEERLRLVDKMDAVGQLTGGIAHEINNLLAVIMANTELMRNASPLGASPFEEELVEVHAMATRGATLIEKLLGFSRSNQLEPQPIDLGEFVAGRTNMLRRLLPASLDIVVDVPVGGATAIADSGTVDQILLNLATNARDAMPSGGRLEISVADTTLDRAFCIGRPGSSPGNYVRLRVRDTGVGMSEEVRTSVFQPFFTTKPIGKGTGLGMATVYGLVKHHRGYIDVASQPGRGTSVSVYLPRAPSLTGGAAAGPLQRPNGGTETILFVEDETALRHAAQRVLQRYGYTVLVAGNGEDGRQMYRSHHEAIDLVISDVVMPRLSGPEMHDAILTEHQRPPPFLFVSGYSPEDSRLSHLLRAGLTLVRKPWTTEELLTAIRHALRDGPLAVPGN